MGHWGTAAGAVSGHIDNHIEDLGSGIGSWTARSSSAALWFDFNFNSIFTATFHVAHTEQTKKGRGAGAESRESERERRREERDEDVNVNVNVGKLRVGFRLALRLATECRAWCARSPR